MKSLLIIITLFITTPFLAQTTINGKVMDEANEPVLGANVQIVGKSIGTITDFDGGFMLKTSELPPFQLKISSLGFSDVFFDITKDNQTLNIVLAESQAQLDEVVISASRTPERIFESPVSIERFGVSKIKNTPSASFYGGLENLKGVDISTNSLTFQSVNTRGFATFANTRFLQLVDGMDNTAPGLNFVLGNLVGLSELDVQSIEILPGASSALYGAGAFNGILFMQSKNPFDYQGISAYVKTGVTSQKAAGSNGYYDLGIRAAHAFNDKLALKANLTYLTGEDWHASDVTDLSNPLATRANPGYDGLNIYGDEVGAQIDFDSSAGLPSGTLGSSYVTRTGYEEQEIIDYKAESLKADFSLHYKPFENDLEIIYNGKYGQGNTIYQGANRYAIRDFTMQMHKLEVRNDNFFLRGYTTIENSGDSYDTRFTAININRAWKSDTDWFTEYTQTYVGARLGLITGAPLDEETAHSMARETADTGRYLPGTPEFQSAFSTITADGDLTTGSKFIDKTKLRHMDGNYNFTHLTKDFADIQVGFSLREYELNSSGTIFTDTDGPIKYNEYGAYTQLQKEILDERLKLTGSIRYDKNEFFDGFVSPRLSAMYVLGEQRNQNIRFSIQQGFRNPTTQDLFIGLDGGSGILVGSAPSNLDRDVRTYNLSPNGTAITGQESVEIVGGAAYENAYSLNSVEKGTFEAVSTPLVKPEEVTAYEVGYRLQLKKTSIDLSGYYNKYKNFISNTYTILPFYGEAGDGSLSLLAIQNGDFNVYQLYTNSEAEIKSYGLTIGVDTRVFKQFDFGINYTFSEQDFDRDAYPDFRTNFNTPKHKVKASFGSDNLFDNFGFNINYRWSDTYFWEASFGDGNIPAYNIVDAQVSYNLPQLKSALKLGGSNLFGKEYYTAVGTGYIGSIYYISWTFNP